MNRVSIVSTSVQSLVGTLKEQGRNSVKESEHAKVENVATKGRANIGISIVTVGRLDKEIF